MNEQPQKAILLERIDGKALLDQIEGLRKDIAQIRAEKDFHESSRYLNRKQVCELAGISLQTLWSKTKSGLFKSYNIGNVVRYLESEVIAAIASTSKQTA